MGALLKAALRAVSLAPIVAESRQFDTDMAYIQRRIDESGVSAFGMDDVQIGNSDLEWSKTLCNGKRVLYHDAEKAVADLGPEWRMPTRKEWESILDLSRYMPALNTDQHPDVKLEYHWTSTPCAWAPESVVWVVNPDNGCVDSDDRDYDAVVRAVRVVGAPGPDASGGAS